LNFEGATETATLPNPNRDSVTGQQFVTFVVGDRTYGVEIVQVREIKQWTPVTALPNQHGYTRGVLNLRGTVVPVHDLRSRFGNGITEATPSHVVIITWIGEQTVGILVDAVSDIISINPEEIRPAPPGGAARDEAAINGLVDCDGDMVAIINLEQLFVHREEDSA